jgi:hypothetical protein
MGYLGTKPANSPLTSELIPDGMIGTSDLANGAVTQDKLSTYIAPKGTPAFSAYAGAATSLSNNAYTKVLFNTEEYDTNSNYDTSLSRFQPTVAGYYQISACITFSASQSTETVLEVYKNGSQYQILQDVVMTGLFIFSGSTLVYANGSTDYFEIYAFQSRGSALNTSTGLRFTRFNGAMVRAA